jgi:peptidoglycan hydrolase-like protein with peptidoglycan-binding domain
MPGLTDNEARALSYFAIGVSSEGGDVAYRLSFAGNIRNDAQGHPTMHPIGNSGFSIGTLQTDLGQHPEVATELTDAYQAWARTAHPDWTLTPAQRTQTIADLGRTGHQIEAQQGRPLDATVKSHLDAFMASDAGISFVHQHDTAQVNKLMTNAIAPLQQTDLYRQASEADQARLITMTAKLYNQSETYGNRLIGELQRGQHHSVDEVRHSIDRYPDYVTDGRDHALAGAALFNDMRDTGPDHPLRPAWDSVVSNPLVNPTQLGNDPTHPDLPHEYSAIRDAFTDPAHSRAMVQALGQGGSYAQTSNHRGFYAEGRDLVTWDRSGRGEALINGQWQSVNSRDISTHVNADRTLDVNVRRNGVDERLLHVTHPGHVRAQAPNHATGDHVQRPGTLREHDHAPAVGDLQRQLAQLGYNGADGRPLRPDNDFGANTTAALKAFQRDHGLGDDGIAGVKTMAALNQAAQRPAAGLDSTSHPGNAMYRQALDGVHAVDAQQGRTPDQLSSNLAASLAVAAHAQGLSRVDHVVLSDDARRAYAVQGELNSPFKQIAEVDVGQSVGKTMAQSSAEWQQAQTQQSVPSQTQQQQQQQQQQPEMHR